MPNALVVDDDPEILSALAELIQREGFETSTATTLADAKAFVETSPPDVVLIDLVLPDGSGMDLLETANGSTQVVLITGHASVDTAVEALRSGASDYLTKPVDIPRLKTVLANILRTRQLKAEVGNLRTELRKLGRFGQLIGASPAMQKIYDMIARVAPADATVFLTGESGVGKDLVSQTIHELSRRREQPFLPLNCGAVSSTLIESELFGHERGSFTGAERLHKGHFERASGGTLFLDEVTEMPIELQVKLLRVLECGTFTRLGGERPLQVDVRVIAATNRDPDEAVKKGKLREDLLYRLKVFPIQVPPLRERGSDIDLLADHFLNLLNKAEGTAKVFSRAVRDRLRSHTWPGNVRQLQNLVHHAYILADDEIGPQCLPDDIAGPLTASGDTGAPGLSMNVGMSIGEAEHRLILATLEECGGDKNKAARILGVSLKTLYNRLNSYKNERLQ